LQIISKYILKQKALLKNNLQELFELINKLIKFKLDFKETSLLTNLIES